MFARGLTGSGMSERWVGVVVSGTKVTVVDAEVPSDDSALVLQADSTWTLQQGDRAKAYNVLHQRVLDYLRDNDISRVVIKATAAGSRPVGKSHLDSAELRGVVMAAAAAVTKTEIKAKAVISRTFGDRKSDEYFADDDFWAEEIIGVDLRSGSREAAMLLLSARKSK